MADRQRWLWVTAELPGDRSTGRLVYSAGLASAIAPAVDLTMVGLGEASWTAAGIRQVPVAAAPRGGISSIVRLLPNVAFSNAVPAFAAAIERLLDDPWDVVVLDHLQVAWALPLIRGRHAGTVVFVTHNHEATVRRTVAAEAPWRNGRRPVLHWDAWKAARLERTTLRSVQLVTAITELDAAAVAIDAPSTPVVVLAPGWSGTTPSIRTPIADRPRRVGVLGSFEWHVKQDNLRQFLRSGDSVLADAGIDLVIGGRAPKDFVDSLEREFRSVRFVGWVEDANAFLDSCRMGLVAEPLGGGFKMKVLDYVGAGVPIAAQASSVAGLPLESGGGIVVADDAEHLARAIAIHLDDSAGLERLASKASAACRELMSWGPRADTLLAAVRGVNER